MKNHSILNTCDSRLFLSKFLILLFSVSSILGQAQTNKKFPEKSILKAEPAMQMRFLAADEMQGRRTGEMGNYVAARYIAEIGRASCRERVCSTV